MRRSLQTTTEVKTENEVSTFNTRHLTPNDRTKGEIIVVMVAEIVDGTETCKPVATAVTAAKGYALVGGVVEGDTFRKIAGDRMVQMVQGNRVIQVTEVTD